MECYGRSEYHEMAAKIAKAGAFAISGAQEAKKVEQMLTQAGNVQGEVEVIGGAVASLDLKGLENLRVTKHSVCHGQGDYTDEIIFTCGDSPYDTLSAEQAEKVVKAVQFLIGLQNGRILT